MLFMTNPANAKSYYLYCSLDNTRQKENRGSRMPKRPLSIDLTHQVITVPNQVIGYTLTLVSEDGCLTKTKLWGSSGSAKVFVNGSKVIRHRISK